LAKGLSHECMFLSLGHLLLREVVRMIRIQLESELLEFVAHAIRDVLEELAGDVFVLGSI